MDFVAYYVGVSLKPCKYRDRIFAYYFFFSVSFRVDTIYTQFVKLAIDLQPLLRFFPWWSLLIVTYVLFEHWRKKFALNKLRKCEAKNCGFINALPIVSMTCGSMGKRKTTMITDMALSQEVMFRQKAFDILQKADMKFPYFPWICFEKNSPRVSNTERYITLQPSKNG